MNCKLVDFSKCPSFHRVGFITNKAILSRIETIITILDEFCQLTSQYNPFPPSLFKNEGQPLQS